MTGPRKGLSLGRLVYLAWYRPLGIMRDSIAAGGPLEQWRTESGRRQMVSAASRLPAPARMPGDSLTLHILTGRRSWFQTAFCLWTFARHSARNLAPRIYDDGTLSAEHREPLARLFPAAQFISQEETLGRLEALLPESRFPVLRERWRNYPNIRKVTDIHVGGSGWKLVLDADLLFFRRPTVLLDWLERPERPLHAVDFETSYGYSRPLMNELAGAAVGDRINVGLTGLDSGELDWERIEFVCRELIGREGTSYFLEQALVAMLVAGRECTVAPERDYVTLPVEPEARSCTAVMHHYVAHSKKWYYRDNWRRALSAP